MEEIDHEYTDEVVCPYCGYEHSDSWEFSEYDDEFECHSCEKHFVMERKIDISYVTKKKK